MPSPRFGATKFRNAVPHFPPRDEWYRSSLPHAADAPPNTSQFSSVVKTNREHVVTLAPSGDASIRAYDAVGAKEGEAWAGKLGAGVADWDLGRLEGGELIVAGTNGTVSYYNAGGAAAPELRHSFTLQGKPTNVYLHPTTGGIALASTATAPAAIYDLGAAATQATLTLTPTDGQALWSSAWSSDGRLVGSVSKKGTAYIWDARAGSAPVHEKAVALQPLKPARVAFVGPDLFVTSFSRTRSRQYSLLSVQNGLGATFTATLDNNQGPLVPLVDEERNIVYTIGRGDMSLRQIELSGPQGYQEVTHPLPSPATSGSLALAHWSTLPVMEAQVASVIVPIVDKDGDTLLPVQIKVPRKQLIDYHGDLFPDVLGTVPEQSAADWFGGSDAKPLPVSIDPSRRAEWEKKTTGWTGKAGGSAAPAAAPAPAPAEPAVSPALAAPAPAPASAPEPAAPKAVENGASATATAAVAAAATPAVSKAVDPPAPAQNGSASASPVEASTPANSVATPTPAVSTTPAAPVTPSGPSTPATATPSAATPATPAAATPVTTAPGQRYNPGWSRKYLGGKAPLNPTYDQIPAPATLHQDSVILRSTPKVAFFSIQGPGGRIAVQPLSKKGRVPNGGHGYLSGGVGVADFQVEPFGDRIVLAGEDGELRIWEIHEGGIEGPGPEPELIIQGNRIEKIVQVTFHPTAKDLLLVASNDSGKGHLRFFDLKIGLEQKVVPFGFEIWNFAIEPTGDRVAIATKKSEIVILDPRDDTKVARGKAHDSLRSFQLAWIDDTHVVSVGFNKGSMRKVQLYNVGEEVTNKGGSTLDVSPSVLFPVFDPDTSILFVWGKGERAIHAFEIHPDHANEPVAKLPSYNAASGAPQLAVVLLPKTAVDVRKVEVARALRLTAKTIEEVTFSIPRNKPAFFQDDIYVPTRDWSTPATGAEAWLEGDKSRQGVVDLRPADMTPLSQAPVTTTAARKKFVPAANVMSEEEKKKQEMDRLFQRAKMEDSDSDDEPQRRGGIPPPDDDW
ncbi:hypothetical protein Q8F55_002151 [Vanrija albida]|uniref:Coronin-7 n=1 Tax=Vanrija albida TaxID=181172 RepID=A0ABR3Q978_9TREE